jgi:cyclopropane fatty-acyl-phospholipid synthase-like methyltransferase
MGAVMNPKSLLVKVYRNLPSGFRAAVRSIKPLETVRRHYFEGDNRLHDLYYTDAYYEDCEDKKWAAESAPIIAADMASQLRPRSVIDVGCGSGEYLEALRSHDMEVHGIELAAAALARCHEKGLEVAPIDLIQDDALPWQADLVCSFEVAEHLPKSGARNFVRLVTSSAREHIVMTAALPGQPGLGHVNCQPKSYWIDLFAEHGFAFDAEMTESWQKSYTDRPVAVWFKQNLMIFHARKTQGQGA